MTLGSGASKMSAASSVNFSTNCAAGAFDVVICDAASDAISASQVALSNAFATL